MVATMDKPRRKIKSLVLLEMSSSLNKFSDPRARYSTKFQRFQAAIMVREKVFYF